MVIMRQLQRGGRSADLLDVEKHGGTTGVRGQEMNPKKHLIYVNALPFG
jgi:hypothetical protein